jgi:alpha-tubulin suppressor-like RCC1 family protein
MRTPWNRAVTLSIVALALALTAGAAWAQNFTVTSFTGYGGDSNPNTPQTVALGGTVKYTLTPITGYQVGPYYYVNGVQNSVPLKGNGNRDPVINVGPIIGNTTVSFTFEPLYTIFHDAYCHTDGGYTPVAGTLSPGSGSGGIAYGDWVTLTFTTNSDYIFRYWADTSVSPFDIPFIYSRGGINYYRFQATYASSPPVIGTNIRVRGYYTRVEWLTMNGPGSDRVRGSDIASVQAYYDYPGSNAATINATRGAPNVRDTGNSVTNPGSPVYIDLSHETWGTPGAVLRANNATWPNISAPLSSGWTDFTGISVDRLGDNYRLTARYSLSTGGGSPRTIYSDSVLPPSPQLTENNGTNNANRGGLTAQEYRNTSGGSYFNIYTTPGDVVAFGYNYFGQLGIDTGYGDHASGVWNNVPRGFPGDYSLSTSFPALYSWPHFNGPTSEAGGWFGNPPPNEPASVDWWFNRTWSYPFNTDLQGKDHYEAVYVEQQTGTHQSVAAGQYHSVRLNSDGTVMTWGSNQYGQLGNGTNTDSTRPVGVTGINNAISIASGMSHSLALIEDGTVRAWGHNNYGQLGDGTTTDRNGPVQVLDPGDPTGFLTDVIAIAAGDDHSLALKKDGALFAWGFNHDGELGNNSTSHSSVAIQVSEFTAARFSINGKGHTSDITTVVFSPTDPTIVATASKDKTARVWQWNQRVHPTVLTERPDSNLVKLVAKLDDSITGGVNAHQGEVNGVAFSPDGNYVYTVSTDKTMKVWNAMTGAWIADVADPAFVGTKYAGKAHSGSVNGVAVSARMGNKYYVVTCAVDRLIKVWSVDALVTPPAPAWTWTVRDNAVSDSGTASGGSTTTLQDATKAWATDRWVSYTVTITAGTGAGQSALVTTNTATVVTVSPAWGTAPDNTSQYQISEFTAHNASVNAVAVNFRGANLEIFSAGADSNGVLPVSTFYAKKWHYDTTWPVPPVTVAPDFILAEHIGSLTSVAVSADGSKVVTGSYDKTAKIWDAVNGGASLATCQSADTQPQTGHRKVVNKVAFSPDNLWVATASDDKTVKRWSVAGAYNATLYNHSAGASAVAFPPQATVSIDKGQGNAADVRSGFNVLLTGGRDFIVKMIILPRVINMDGGGYHSIAADEAGDVWAWGMNVNGQLGDNTLIDRHYPGHVLDSTGASVLNLGAAADPTVPTLQVQAGNAHSLALSGNGSAVWAWGYNRFGECGNGTKNTNNLNFIKLPVRVQSAAGVNLGSASPVRGISAGWGYSMARDTACLVWVWGHNHHGQLGNDDGEYMHNMDTEAADQLYATQSTLYRQTKRKTDPTKTTQTEHRWDRDNGAWGGNSPMTSIAAGYWHSLGITSPTRYTLTWGTDPNQGGTVEKGDVQYDPSDTVYPPQTGVTNEAVWSWAADNSGAVTADSGSTLWVRAIPKPGYRFDHWAGNFAGTNPAQSCTMVRDYDVRAFFVREIRQYQLTIDRIDELGNPLPQGGTVSGDGTYDENTEVVITAVPRVGYDFVEWRGDAEIIGSDRTTERVRMTSSKTIQAVFRVKQIKIYPKVLPPAGGTISWNPAYKSSGYDAGHDLDPNYYYVVYDYGTAVQVQPAKNAGYRFLNWSGDIVGTDDTVWVDVDTTQDRRITATFKKIWNLSIIWSPGGQAFDTTPQQGVWPYDDGVTVNLSARDVTGFKFSQWSGQIVGSPVKSKTAQVVMDQDRTITAEYLGVNLVATNVWPVGSGSVAVGPHPSPFDTNEDVTVTATPSTGFIFTGWTGWSGGAWSGTTLNFKITQNENLTANFIAIDQRAGQIMSWGYNLYGGLGDGTRTTQREPVPVDPTLANHVKRLGGGAYHSLAVKSDGTVIAWGYNSNGQLGDGSTTMRLVPIQVNGLNWPANRVRSVAGGDYHSVALRDDGFVFVWGQGLYGQLGNSQTGDQLTPIAVPGLNNIVAVAAGAYHTLALRADGTLWSCGLNNRGQLGDGTQANSFKVIQVADPTDATGFLQGVVGIAAGDNHSVALKLDGTVRAWGGNNWGQLGDGTIADSVFPVTVSSGGGPLANVAQIACGSFHTLALVETGNVGGVRVGNVMAWGWNLFGQLGDKGALPQQYSAVPVLVQTASGTLDNIVIDVNGDTTVAGGYGYSMALRLHTVGAGVTKVPWTWGRNLVGELGNGAQVDSNVAVQISNLSEIRSLGAGRYHGLAMINPLQHKLTGVMTPLVGGLSIVASGLDGKGQVVAPVLPGAEPYFDESELVTFTANPQPGYKFNIWTGDLAGAQQDLNPASLIVDADKSVTANFLLDPLLYALNYSVLGSGQVVPDKVPDVAPNLYRSGTPVTLTAVADPGFTFSGWTGDVVSLSPAITVTMSGHRSVTATFSPAASFRTITTLANPVAGGTVTGGGDYALNSTATLTATPNPGYRFYYWEVDGSSDINDNANPRSVIVDNNHTFTARFVITSGNPGTLLAWGSNAYGQIGDGTNQDRLQPTAVQTLQDVTEFSAGQYHMLALQSNGTVYAWGDNANGQLGFVGPPMSSTTPGIVNFPFGTRIKQVAAGAQFSLAVDTAGNVWAWGDNAYGQLGDNTTTPHAVPAQIAGIAGVDGVIAGESHVLALLDDGTVRAWGYNIRGQLGVGDATDRWVPTQVVDPTDPTGFLTGIEALAAGAMHSLALKDGGAVLAWGFNGDGELGNNTVADSAVPVQVLGGLPQITSIACGSYHSLAVDASGYAWSWGYNAAGQLGNGTTVSTGAGVPTLVRDTTDASGYLTNVVRIAGGYAHSVAIRSDSTARAWGDNTWGQLGDLTRLSRTLPVQVMQAAGVVLTDIGFVVAGWTHSTAEVNPVYFRIITIDDTADKGRVEGGGTFVRGSIVTLTAIEYAGGQFQRWEASPVLPGSPNLTAPTLQVTVDQNYTVTGHFVRNVTNSYKLRVNRVPNLSASVIKVDPGVAQGTDAQGPYYLYTFSPATVTVDDALARSLGYTFGQWQGPVVPTSDPLVCNVLLEPQPAKDITITAVFDLLCDLYVDSQVAGGAALPGAVIDSAAFPGVTNYNWPDVRAGTTVDLQVNPGSKRMVVGGATYDFMYWVVNGTQYGAGVDRVVFPIAVQPTGAIAVYRKLLNFSVQSSGIAGVAITSTPPGYGGTTPYPPPTVNVYEGDSFTLTAPATWPAVNPTHDFKQWRLNGVDQPVGLATLDFVSAGQDIAAVAVYVVRRSLVVQSSPVGNVTIGSTSGQGGVTDPVTLSYSTVASDQTLVDLVAPPWTGSPVCDFIQWKWNGVAQAKGQQALFKTITANASAQAVYGLRRVLTVRSTGNGVSMPGVTVTSATGHGGTTNYFVNTIDKTSVKLTAPATFKVGSVDYVFADWKVTGPTTDITTTSATVTFTIGEDVTAEAQYAITQRRLTAAAWYGSTALAAAITAVPAKAGPPYPVNLDDEQVVTLTVPATYADPATQRTFSFSKWVVNGVTLPVVGSSVTFTMTTTTTAAAYYVPKAWDVSIQSTPITGVSITGSSGHSGKTNYAVTWTDSTVMTLTAPATVTSAGALYNFQVWNINGVDQSAGNTVYTTTIRSDVTAIAKYAIVTHGVAVRSTGLAGVPVQVNGGASVTTDTVVSVNDNASVTLTVTQLTGTVAGTTYGFDRWTLDGVNQPKGQVDLTVPNVKTDTRVAIAVYTVVMRALSVDSQPVRGIAVNVNGLARTTLWTNQVADNTMLTLTAPLNATVGGVAYVFDVWNVNGVDQTPGALTFNNGGAAVKNDVAAIARYKYVQQSVQIQSTGVTGVDIAVTGGWTGTATTNTTLTVNDSSSLTLTAPATQVSGSVTYYFKRWTLDGVQQPFNQRVLTISNIKTGRIAVALYGDDNAPPVATLEAPKTLIETPLDGLVQVLVTDAKSGVDYKSVVITLNGQVVYNGAAETQPGLFDTKAAPQAVRGVCRRLNGPTLNDWRFVFEPSARFEFGQTVDLVVNAMDKQSVPISPAFQRQFAAQARTFGPGVKVNSDSNQYAHSHVAAALDALGTRYVVWDQVSSLGDTNLYIGYSGTGGTSFSPSNPVPVSPPDTRNQGYPAICWSAKSNRVYVAWQDDRFGQWDIFVAYATPVVFNAWTQTRVTLGSGTRTRPAIAVDATGKVYVAWEEAIGGVRNIRVASSTNGTTWATVTTANSAFDQSEPCIAISSSTNDVFVLWTDARNQVPGHGTDIYGFSSANAWVAVPIATNAAGQSSPTLAIEPGTTALHMAWTGAAAGNNDIFYGTSIGLPGGPLAGVNVTQDAAAQTLPSISVAGAGNDAKIFLAWQDGRQPTVAGETDIYFADIRPGVVPATVPPWVNVLVNGDAAAASSQSGPEVLVDGTQQPVVFWSDTRLGGLDIYAGAGSAVGANVASNAAVVDHTKAAVRQVQGAPIGKDGVINGPNDVLVQIPANAMAQDAVVSIAPILNPPALPAGAFGTPYDFGPSGMQFATPVTIYLPHAAAACPNYATWQAYFYDPLDVASPTFPWSRNGISNVQHVVISSTVHAVQFQATHFSTYTASGSGTSSSGSGGSSSGSTSSSGGGGGGGGGWCFIATAAYNGDLPGAVISPEGLDRLNTLRGFRQEVLMPSELGRKATSWYSAVSPPVAGQLAQSPAARQAVRQLFVNPLAQAVGGILEEAR